MARIIRSGNNLQMKRHVIEEFSSTDKGETSFEMEDFGDNVITVQENAVHEFHPTSSSNKSRMNDRPNDFDDEFGFNNMPNSGLTTITGETKSFEELASLAFGGFQDSLDDSGITMDNPKYTSTEEQDIAKRLAAKVQDDEAGFTPVDISGEEIDKHNVNVPKSQVDLLDEDVSARVSEINEKLESVSAELAKKGTELASLTEKFNALTAESAKSQEELASLKTSLPGQLEAAKKEGNDQGYEKGRADQKVESDRNYEAQKEDYISKIEKQWIEAIKEISKIEVLIKSLDEQLPEIIIAYLRELVGAERKLNDMFVVGLIKSSLSRLTDIQHLVFTVNPMDADSVASVFPQYGISIDPTIDKGGVKVQTKVGEVDLSVESWIDGLAEKIHEQFKDTKDNKTK